MIARYSSTLSASGSSSCLGRVLRDFSRHPARVVLRGFFLLALLSPMSVGGFLHLWLLQVPRWNYGCWMLSLALRGCSCTRYTSTRRLQFRTHPQTLLSAQEPTKSLSCESRRPLSLVFLWPRWIEDL